MFTNDCSLAESVTKTLPLEKDEDNKESKSKEFEVRKDEKVAVDVAAEPKASDSEQTDAKEEVADQSEAPEQHVDTVEEPEPQAGAQWNTVNLVEKHFEFTHIYVHMLDVGFWA